jgi:hypothetical protein
MAFRFPNGARKYRAIRTNAHHRVNARRLAALRAQGVGWKRIAARLGLGVGTYRFTRDGSKIGQKFF